MHSRVFHISRNKKAFPEISYSELDNLQSVNNAIDYFEEDIIPTEQIMDDKDLEGLFPDFIKVTSDGEIKVSQNSKKEFKEWSETFITRMREWQNRERTRLGFHALYVTDINTNDDNAENWYHVDSIFNIMGDDDSNDFIGYLDCILNLAEYHQGETLYIVGASSFHY